MGSLLRMIITRNVTLDSLPEELIKKIFDFCDKPYRQILSQVSKRFRSIYLSHFRLKLLFHLQGHTDTLLREGLHFLLHRTSIVYKELRISKFNLSQSLDHHFSNGDLFGCPLESYRESCKASKSITTLSICECIVTDQSLLEMRALFPKVNSLKLDRQIFVSRDETYLTIDKFDFHQPIKHLSLSLPFYTNVSNRHFGLKWLISYCRRIEKLDFGISIISEKRPIARRFYKMYPNEERGLSEIVAHVESLWSDLLANEDAILKYDADTLKTLTM